MLLRSAPETLLEALLIHVIGKYAGTSELILPLSFLPLSVLPLSGSDACCQPG